MGSVRKLTKLVPAMALAAGLTTPFTAQAADLLMEPAVIEAPEVRSSGGWYLRGDISYDLSSSNGASYYPDGATYYGGLTAVRDYDSATFEDAFNVGLGIGHQFTDQFRVDLTGDYVFDRTLTAEALVNATNVCAGLQTAGGGSTTDGTEPGNCTSTDTTDATTIKLLANAYWDIGNYNGFTPYVGAGIGGAYVQYGNLTSIASGDFSCCVNLEPQETANLAGVDSWRFAYALHAGFSYDLTHSMKLDLGYSYTDIQGGAVANFPDGSGPQVHDKGFKDHVIRAGVRYQIW